MARLQQNSATGGASVSVAFGSDVQVGSLIVVVGAQSSFPVVAFSAGDCTKIAGTATLSALTLDQSNSQSGPELATGIWSAIVTGAGSLTLQIANSGSFPGTHIHIAEYDGDWDASRVEDSSTGSTDSSNTNAATGNATSAAAAVFVGGVLTGSVSGVTITEDGAFSLINEERSTPDGTLDSSAIDRIVASGTTDAASWTLTNNDGWSATLVVYREAGEAPVTPWKATDVDNGGTTTGYDPVLTVPASAVEGDRMTVLVLTTDNNPSIAPTPPATETWTLEASGSMPIDGTAAVSPPGVWIYGKDVSADDEANAGTKTYTWTFGGAEEQVGVLLLTEPATFGQFAKNELTGNRTSIDAPSVTTTDADELVYHCALKDNGVLFSGLPSGISRAHEALGATNGAGGALAIVEEVFETPGATGAKTFTHDSDESNGFTFSLVVAAAGAEVAASDIAQSQVLDAVSITQTHLLTVSNIAQAQALDATGLTQDHGITVGEIDQAQALEAPAITQDHQLAPGEIAQIQTLEAPSITQDHQVAIDNIVQAQLMDGVGLTQDHQIGLGGIVQAQVLEAPTATVVHQVGATDIAQTQVIDAPGISQDHLLTASNIATQQTLDAATLTQTHLLVVNDTAQTQILDQVELIVAGAVTPQDIAQIQALGTVLLSQDHQLAPGDIVQLQVLDPVTASQSHLVAPDDIAQTQAVDTVTMVVTHALTPSDIAQDQVIGPVTITQAHLLVVADIAQAQMLDAVGLISQDPSDLPKVAGYVRLRAADGSVVRLRGIVATRMQGKKPIRPSGGVVATRLKGKKPIKLH